MSEQPYADLYTIGLCEWSPDCINQRSVVNCWMWSDGQPGTLLLCDSCVPLAKAETEAAVYTEPSASLVFDRYLPIIRFPPGSDGAYCLLEAWCTLAAVCE